jgi:hypothetical protein
MITYISEIIPRIQRYSQKLDNITLLTNQHWVVVDEISTSKTVYIFRPNNDLIVSRNGLVNKGRWEYLGSNSILIELTNDSFLFRHGFFDENILALKSDGKDEYAFLVNETKFEKELNSLKEIQEFLEKKYLSASIPRNLPETDQNQYKEAPTYTKKETEPSVAIIVIVTILVLLFIIKLLEEFTT